MEIDHLQGNNNRPAGSGRTSAGSPWLQRHRADCTLKKRAHMFSGIGSEFSAADAVSNEFF